MLLIFVFIHNNQITDIIFQQYKEIFWCGQKENSAYTSRDTAVAGENSWCKRNSLHMNYASSYLSHQCEIHHPLYSVVIHSVHCIDDFLCQILRIVWVKALELGIAPFYFPFYGLFTLNGTRTRGGTENRTGTIGNNEPWSMSLSQTSVNISTKYIRISPSAIPGRVPVQCA